MTLKQILAQADPVDVLLGLLPHIQSFMGDEGASSDRSVRSDHIATLDEGDWEPFDDLADPFQTREYENLEALTVAFCREHHRDLRVA